MKHTTTARYVTLTTTLVILPALAQAHPGHDHSGFAAGAGHPLSGIDHILAMIAVGVWAVQLGGRALWAVPASFVSMMAIGGALAMAGIPFPYVEQGILCSVLILGLLIAAAARVPLLASMLMVAGFALFHGHAHGAEMPLGQAGLTYGAGFVLSTVLLHASGIAGALFLAEVARRSWLRMAGGAIVAGGVAMALGWI